MTLGFVLDSAVDVDIHVMPDKDPSTTDLDIAYRVLDLIFNFLFQKTYTEEELNAKLTRRVQKAARRQAKQEELKRLHRAQVKAY